MHEGMCRDKHVLACHTLTAVMVHPALFTIPRFTVSVSLSRFFSCVCSAVWRLANHVSWHANLWELVSKGYPFLLKENLERKHILQHDDKQEQFAATFTALYQCTGSYISMLQVMKIGCKPEMRLILLCCHWPSNMSSHTCTHVCTHTHTPTHTHTHTHTHTPQNLWLFWSKDPAST